MILLQGKAPKPKSDNINIVLGPEARAYVREFGGFATEDKALEEAVRLKADLLEDKVSQPPGQQMPVCISQSQQNDIPKFGKDIMAAFS